MFGILILIVLNLALGYALALYFHRPELLSVAWRIFPTVMPPVSTVGATNSGFTAIAAAPTAIPLAKSPVPAGRISQVEAEAISQAVLPPENSAALPTLAQEMVAGMASIPIDPTSASPEVQQAVALLIDQLNKYCAKVGALDETIKVYRQGNASSDVKVYAQQFDKLSDDYLTEQRRNLESIRRNAAAEVQALAEPCTAAVEQHSSAIATTREEMTLAASLADSAAACRAFLASTSRLSDASNLLHGKLDRTWKPVAAKPTNSLSTVGLEKAIAEFISQQPDPDGKFSVALVDADQLPTINENCGRAVGYRILHAIAQTFIGLAPSSTLATDKERQQFLFFQPDSSAREATNGVEKARQRIDAATFQLGTLQWHITLSCGVAEATCHEEPAKIVLRLQEILREAQRYGCNRTFFQEGETSAPAIPPVMNVEKRVIEV